MEMEDYLQDGFDPRSVTMPRLRSILVTHNIHYGNAKKAQLVAMVEDQVMPLVPRLREQKLKAKRSSMGIVNAGSAEDNGFWDDYDLAPPSTTRRRSRSPRKTFPRMKSQDRDDPLLRSPSKRGARTVSGALSHATDTYEQETPRPTRATRRTVTPQIKVESESDDNDDEDLPPAHEQSFFTDDNPFQQGSSPPQNRTPGSRRRTGEYDTSKSARSSRRRSEFPKEPMSLRIPKTRPHFAPEADMEPGEEFTPTEQLELEEAAHKGEASLPRRKASRKSKRRFNLTTPLAMLFLTLIGSYAFWYRQEKIAVGYCGLGRPAKELLPPNIPVPDFFVPFVEPQCEQCPSHAYCYDNLEARCEPDFVLQQHPLSLGGLVPLPPTCQPDGEKARRVQAVADKAVEELRDRRAKFECGELVNDEGKQQDSPAIRESELKATVSRKRSKRLNSAEFEELWAAAIGEVTAREEVEVEVVQTPSSSDLSNRNLSSTSLARLSFACSIKRAVRLGLVRNRFTIGLLITLVASVFYLRHRYRKHVSTSAQIPALVDLVLGRLANQKELGEEDIDEPWLSLPNLRDDVLRSVHSLSERERIWQRVKAVVELNSNVRTSQREGKSGEVGRAWEWIGPVGGDVARRRKSGRVSWIRDSMTESPESQKDTPQVKKWEEPRPVY